MVVRLNITEIWQLRRRKKNKVEIAENLEIIKS